MKKILVLTLLLAFLSLELMAQCSMCASTVETSRQDGGEFANSINDGIIYLLMMPFLAIISIVTAVFYQKRKRNQEAIALQNEAWI